MRAYALYAVLAIYIIFVLYLLWLSSFFFQMLKKYYLIVIKDLILNVPDLLGFLVSYADV